jgi:hypothetical protein
MPSGLLAIALLSAACASASIPVVSPPPSSPPGAATAPVATAPAVPAPAPATAEPPPALREALAAAKAAIAAGNLTAADQPIAAALAAAGDDDHLAYLVARVRATRFVYAGDFERAAAAYLAVLPALAKHPELPDEFWSHNAMMMIREAQGDPAAALAENDQATICAGRGTWDPRGRAALAWQKDRWHRAYLTRMLAESRTGSVKQALTLYARAALDEYRASGFPDSVAVLEAYFAALDGQPARALAAAKRVDPAKDDDVEDLYLVVVGLEAGGDHTAAEAVRRAMRRSEGVHIARAIMLRWLDLDAKGARDGFTPWHAGSR